MDDFQFYPTPPELARRAWKKFKRDLGRVLEPSAGNGDLTAACPQNQSWGHRQVEIDAIEIDVTRHATLRDKGMNVVGVDFLSFQAGAQYGQILLNPPFAQGAKHVLHAWRILWDGEIVAILNADTIRNPFSRERQALVDLISEHGDVEFVGKAFLGADVEVQADVEVALVYLEKKADTNTLVGDLLAELQRDKTTEDTLVAGFQERHDIAVPTTVIENSVRAFNAAVSAMKESVFTEARAGYYATLLGDTLSMRDGESSGRRDVGRDWVKKEIGQRYSELQDRAWAGILRGSMVTDRLSAKGQKRVEAEFEQIKKLEFTEANIYGFLSGLADSQGQLMAEMACDIFDKISRDYRDGNCVLYRGWKSNTRHWIGLKIKTTRFVLPGFKTEKHDRNLDWSSRRELSDFDKVFCMLVGKTAPDYGLVDAFSEEFESLRKGARVSTDFFDIRYYPGIGTIHFFPRDKALIDRFNRYVGRFRGWLPPDHANAPRDFVSQYEQADKLDKEIAAELAKLRGRTYWRHPVDTLFWKGSDENERNEAFEKVDAVLEAVQSKHGIHVNYQIGQCAPTQLRLAA